MADFTSIATGNWNDGPTTWGTGEGVYPGSTGSQADTAVIAATHNVELNITAPAAGATVTTVTVNAGSGGGAAGTLTIGAVMSSAWIGTLSTTYTAGQARGRLVWKVNTAASLLLATAFNPNGDFDLDATGASAKHLLRTNFSSWSFGANATITNLKGRTKTVAAQFAGAPSGTYTYVDDGAGGDVTGWEVNDYLVGVKSTATYDRKIIAADGGFGGGKHTYTCSLSSSLQDNGRCGNATRSAVIENTSSASYGTTITLPAGLSITNLQYVEFAHVGVTIAATPCADFFKGCAFWNTLRQTHLTINASCTLNNVLSYNGSGASQSVLLTGADLVVVEMQNCYLLNTSTTSASTIDGSAVNGSRTTMRLSQCELSAGVCATGGGGARYRITYDVQGCYFWGSNATAFNIASGEHLFVDCVFGADIGGNSNVNSTDFTITAGLAVLENCNITGTTLVTITGDKSRIISVQNGNVSGARKEWQGYGTCTSMADPATPDDFASGYCDQIDPSSATIPFVYRIVFPCDTGKTPTLTFYQKSITQAMGACTVTLGYRRSGLTGINAGGTITVDADGGISQHTVTFAGTTDCAGEVEVLVNVLDGSTPGGLFMVGDIAVSGNL
jgi:hypothetical protein